MPLRSVLRGVSVSSSTHFRSLVLQVRVQSSGVGLVAPLSNRGFEWPCFSRPPTLVNSEEVGGTPTPLPEGTRRPLRTPLPTPLPISFVWWCCVALARRSQDQLTDSVRVPSAGNCSATQLPAGNMSFRAARGIPWRQAVATIRERRDASLRRHDTASSPQHPKSEFLRPQRVTRVRGIGPSLPGIVRDRLSAKGWQCYTICWAGSAQRP